MLPLLFADFLNGQNKMNRKSMIFFTGCILWLVIMAPLASTSFFATDRCEENDKTCMLHQRLQDNRIKQFQKELLVKLNMKEPPNVSKSDLPSQITIASMKKILGIDRLDRLSEINSRKMKTETKEIFSMSKLVPNEKIEESDEGCYFEMTDDKKKFKAQKSTLWLYILPNTTRLGPSVAQITLIHFKKAGNGSYIPVTGQTLHIPIKSDKGHWLKIEITDSVNGMLFNKNMFKLMKVIPTKDAQDIVLTTNEEKLKPYMQTALVEDTTLLKRGKRSSGSQTPSECSGKNVHLHCCLFDMELNFEQVGMDWVLYPKSFNAKYCTGGCNYAHTRDTMRGKMLAHATDYLTEDQTKSCCAPKEMLPLSIIYRDSNNNVVISKVEDMVISGCNCV